MLRLEDLHVRRGGHPCAARHRPTVEAGRDRRTDRRERRRQDDDARHDLGPAAPASGIGSSFTPDPEGETARPRPDARRADRRRRHLALPGRAAGLRRAHGGREPADRRLSAQRQGRRRRRTSAEIEGHVPDPARARLGPRRPAVGRRADDAGDRPRADEPAEAAAARRAVAGPRAAARRADLRHPRNASAAEGITILLVEQNAAMALDLADRAYVLEAGTIVLSGTGPRARRRTPKSSAPIWERPDDSAPTSCPRS